MLEAYAVVETRISFLLSLPISPSSFNSFGLFWWSLHLLSLFLQTSSRSVWPWQRNTDFLRAKKKEKKREKGGKQTGNPQWMGMRDEQQENQARKWRANLRLRTFPRIVSRAVRWEQGSESWWAFVLHNNHQVRQRRLPIHPIVLASLSFSACPITSPASLMWHSGRFIPLHTLALNSGLLEQTALAPSAG